MASYFREQLEDWVKEIDVKAKRVLDVGGAQLPIKKRVKSWEVEDYKILDLPDPHKGEKPDIVADLQEPDIGFCSEMGTGDEPIYPYHQYFDVAFCLEVMEYIWNPIRALRNIGHLLKKDGILYISFPFIYPHHNPEGKDYLRYTRWGAEKLLEEAGFEILEIAARFEKPIQSAAIRSWFSVQEMRPSKSYLGHDEVGYMVKAKKI